MRRTVSADPAPAGRAGLTGAETPALRGSGPASACVLLAGCLWGTMGLFVRHFSGLGLSPAEIGEIRILFGLLLVGAYLAFFSRRALIIRLRDVWCFLGTGVGSLLLMEICEFSAMEHGSVALASILLYTAPAFVMLFSALFFRETVTWRKLLALVLAFAGCAMVSGIGTARQASLPGILLGLGAGLAYSLYTIFGRFALSRGYSPWTIIFWSFLFCAAFGAPLCGWTRLSAVLFTADGLLWGAGMGLATAFAPYLLYSFGLSRLESGKTSILASSEPVVASLISVLVFREPMPPLGVPGIVLVLGAVVLLSGLKPKKAGK